jgi:hypothetical protein
MLLKVALKLNFTLNQGIQNLRNSFLRGFPLPFNVETLQAFGALFQIPHYYRKFSHWKLKMLFNILHLYLVSKMVVAI